MGMDVAVFPSNFIIKLGSGPVHRAELALQSGEQGRKGKALKVELVETLEQ